MLQRSALALGFLLPLAAPASAQDGLRLEHIVPGDVFAFVEFAGLDACSEAAAELGLYQLWNEEEVQEFLAVLIDEYNAMAGQTPAGVQEEWDFAKALLGGRMSVALGELHITWADEAPMPHPGGVIALDVTGRREQMIQAFDQFLPPENDAAMGFRRGIEERSGFELIRFDQVENDPKLSLYVTFVENLMLVGVEEELIGRCLDNLVGIGEGDTLAGSGAFQRARSKSQGERLLELYLNVDALFGRIEGLIPVEVMDLLENLGLADINAVYYTSAVHAGDSFDTLYLDAPGERRGLMSSGGEGGITAETLARVPASAAHFTAMQFNAGHLFDTLWGAFEGFAPADIVAEASEEMSQAEQMVGFQIRDGLLASLGEELVLYTELPQNGFIPNVVATMELADEEQFGGILDILLGMGGVPLREISYRGHQIQVIAADDLPIAPAFTMHGGHLIVALSPGSLKNVLKGMEEGLGASITSTEGFAETFDGLAWEGAGMVQYIDVPRLAAFGYNAAENLLPGMVDEDDLPVDLYMMPSQETVLTHLNGWADVGYSDADGVVFNSRAISIASVLALAARWMDESPGCPPYLMMAEAQGNYGYAEEAYAVESASASAPTPSVAQRAEERYVPDGVVNPVAAGDPREAELRQQLEQLTSALESSPDDSGLHFNVGLLHGQLSEFEHAIAGYERAMDLGFNPATCSYNLACTYSLMEREEESLEWLREAFEQGFERWELVEHDSDLDNVRHAGRFDELVQEYNPGA